MFVCCPIFSCLILCEVFDGVLMYVFHEAFDARFLVL